MMLIVMDFHRLGVDIRLESVERIRQSGQRVRHLGSSSLSRSLGHKNIPPAESSSAGRLYAFRSAKRNRVWPLAGLSEGPAADPQSNRPHPRAQWKAAPSPAQPRLGEVLPR